MLELRELQAPTLKELFIQEIEKMILSGKLKIGDKLPSERELSEQMKVSRSVIAAGLVELKNKGFLITIPRSGTYVEDYRREGRLDTLVSIINYNGGRFRKEDACSLVVLRSALKQLATESLFENLTEEKIQILEHMAKNIATANTLQEQAKATMEFDHELAFQSGNTILPLIFSSFSAPYKTLITEYYQIPGIHSFYVELMQNYCLFVRSGDLEGAISSIKRGTKDAIEHIKKEAWPLLP